MTIVRLETTVFRQTAEPSTGTIVASSKDQTPSLFQPLNVRSITLKNRIVVSPMCMFSAEDGFMNDFHFVHLGQFANYGVGLIIVEATAVLPNGRISPVCTGLWKDEHMEQMKRIVDYVHNAGSLIGIQIGHAGRKASTPAPYTTNKAERATLLPEQGGWSDIWAPSPIQWNKGWVCPHEMTIKEISTLKQAFVASAIRADNIGYDVLEIHGAHGYLINQFLSPISNQRNDEYGGGFENRIRFPLEIIKAVRQVWPKEKPLFFRISCVEWAAGGWSLEETIEFSRRVFPLGVDLLDCSTGGNLAHQKIPITPGYQVPFAEKVKSQVPELLTGAVGLITDAHQANDIIENNQADVVLLGRELLQNTSWTLKAAHELGADVSWPTQYGYCCKRRT